MTREQLFSVYSMDRRLVGLTGYDVEPFPHLTCFTPCLRDREGLVTFANLESGQEARQIQQQADYFTLVGVPFRWRIFDFDHEASAIGALIAAGFGSATSSALMTHYFDASFPPPQIPHGIQIEHATTPAQIERALNVYSVAFQRSHSHLVPAFVQQIEREPDTLSIITATCGGHPIAAAWIEYPRGSQFPELHPEAVLPGWHAPSLVEALMLYRLHEVHSRLYNYAMAVVHTDCIESAQSFGFKLVSMRTTLRSHSHNPWELAALKKAEADAEKAAKKQGAFAYLMEDFNLA